VKRKVLIIVENMPVPLDFRVWKEARSLHGAGYDVTVLCPKGRGYNETYEQREGIHIYRHPTPKEANSPAGYVLEYACALFWEFLYSWWIYFRRGFHVVQGCNPPDDIFLVVLPFKLFGVKYVFDHHDVNPELYFSKYEKKDLFYKAQLWLEKATFRCSDVVMSTNNSYREIAISRGGMDEQDVFVVRNGPDLNTFKPASPNPARKFGKRYLVGYVGNMDAQEGLDILVDVALIFKNIGRRDVHFTCVGGGPGLPKLRQLVSEKNVDDMITFTGRISDAEMLEVLSTADVCVNPDKPCPMNNLSTMIKIMEYMALEKPIVQFEGTEGRFSAQGASLYSDGSDYADDFAEKIGWLLDHPEERVRMGKLGRKRIETELAWQFSVKKLLAAYEKAFSKVPSTHSLQPIVLNAMEGAAECNTLTEADRDRSEVTPVLPGTDHWTQDCSLPSGSIGSEETSRAASHNP
jgi:glycosyltransferase involved in cell wall biosynthesis